MVGVLLMAWSLVPIFIGLVLLSIGIEWFEIGFAVMNDRG